MARATIIRVAASAQYAATPQPSPLLLRAASQLAAGRVRLHALDTHLWIRTWTWACRCTLTCTCALLSPQAAHNVADHMEMLRDKSPWASFMTFLGTNQLDVASLIFPWAAVGSGDLAGSYHWVEWYGRDLDVRRVIKTLSANEFLFDQSDSETGATGGASVGSAEGTVSLK